MLKKNMFFFLIICFLYTEFAAKGMDGEDNGIRELPRRQQEQNYPEEDIARNSYRIGLAQGIATRTAQRIIAQKSVSDALKEGALVGLEQGAATLVASLMIEIAQKGIAKATESWNQLSKEEQEQLRMQLELRSLIESLEKGIEKKQKILAGNSNIISTAGEHMPEAQEIFLKKYEQTTQELETQINELIDLETKKLLFTKQKNIELFKNKLQEAHHQKVLTDQENSSVHSNSDDPETTELSDELDGEALQKIEQYVEQEEILYEIKLDAFKKGCEKIKKGSLEKLHETSPEAKFAQLYGIFSDMALNALQEQRAMMDGTLIKQVVNMMEQQKKSV